MKKFLTVLALFSVAAGALAVERFPPPDLGEGYVYPQSYQAPARMGWLAWVDVAVLLAALLVGAALAHRGRSRKGILWLTGFSVIYFGFYRLGCVCPIGSIQNVAQGIFDKTYLVPWSVLAFFSLPLLFALVFGRVFCGGVCPLGAVQELLLIKAIKVPRWLDHALRMVPFVYLGLAVLLAATGTQYIICKYDPFVPLFRMAANSHIWLLTGAFVVASLFIGRPYCRFLCPYGALLGIFSRFSARRVSITPGKCITCHLCKEACPYGAIEEGERK